MTRPFGINREARRAHLATLVPVPPPLPAPAVTSRDPWPADVPDCSAAAKLLAYAQRCGWNARSTYARGPWLSARGVVLHTAHTVAVRGGLLGRYFHACYVRPVGGDGWTCEVVLLAPADPAGIFPYAGVTDLKEWITDHGVEPVAWYTEITARRAAQAARVKTGAAGRKPARNPL